MLKYVWKVSTSKAIFQESLSALCIILSESARGCLNPVLIHGKATWLRRSGGEAQTTLTQSWPACTPLKARRF